MSILEFLLYLIYGFSMITMGIFAVMQKDSRLMNINLIKSLKYLGFFAIIHGMTEWITMIQKLELCHPYLVIEVHYTNMILKALSFVFLLHFGLDLLPVRDKYKSVLTWIPMAAFLAYLSGFFLLIWSQGVEYHLTNKMFNTIVIRYLLALPSCMTAAAALYFNARLIKITKSVEISHRYRNLALILIVYGLIEGLLVAKAAYFPANIIHNEIFPAYFSLMTLSFKAVAGFAINYLLIKVMDTFSWEQEARMQQLEQSRIAAEERRKMGLEIHDGIIQDLYAMGLKLEYLSTGQGSAAGRDILDEVKGNLSASIDKIRDCITSNAWDEIQLDSLKDKLERLVQKYNGSQGIKIKLESTIYRRKRLPKSIISYRKPLPTSPNTRRPIMQKSCSKDGMTISMLLSGTMAGDFHSTIYPWRAILASAPCRKEPAGSTDSSILRSLLREPGLKSRYLVRRYRHG